jgi:hypothetical protein
MTRVETIPELYNTTLWKFKSEGNANIILSYAGKNIRYVCLKKDVSLLILIVILLN